MTSWSDIIKYTNQTAKTSDPFITITKNKALSFSSGFVRKNAELLATKSHLVLSYSKANNAIVIEFTANKKLAGILKITKNSGSGGYSVAIRSFINTMNIDPQKIVGRRYTPVLEKIPNYGEVHVIYLEK